MFQHFLRGQMTRSLVLLGGTLLQVQRIGCVGFRDQVANRGPAQTGWMSGVSVNWGPGWFGAFLPPLRRRRAVCV